ncbi:envelope glycoprotein O [Mandrillus leucophaeus cytomegalovirus]|uniref:Envelope glycoprotein O n=1 Tax=Mandrillus leucophaeus cytomegalovirus TaxID=1654930 RepID=A0A0G2UM10_9BETA|nr:envelope glycoprotein O [Mandrillus leucophaeus cytomegalovirus]AKI29772.1 envelope glycoprotein O [Mandrillus leucophaeus cytomegalovirus]
MGSVKIKWYTWLIVISYVCCAANKRKTTTIRPAYKITQMSFLNHYYTFNLSHLPPTHYLTLAGPIRNDSITYFWYDFHGPWNRKPTKYILSKYNHTAKQMSIIPPPCGSIPSMTCLSQMLNISLHNDTGEGPCNLTTTFNTMLFNIPRWTTKIYVSSSIVAIDSQTLYFLGLSAAVFRQLRQNCSESFYLTNAMSRNLFRGRVSLTKLKNTFRRLKRKQHDKHSKKHNKSVNYTTAIPMTSNTNINNTNDTIFNASEVFKPPIFITQLKDMVTWIYTTLRYTEHPFCTNVPKDRPSAFRNHTHQIVYNATPLSIHGYINLTSLYHIPPPYETNATINNSFLSIPGGIT